MKYPKEIVEAACINADTIDDVKKILGINGSYAYTLLKKYNLSITKKKIGRPNIKNTTQIRAECTAIAKAKREALFKATEFLDAVYIDIPYQQRTWHIRNDILDIKYCICGNPMVFMAKRYKYCSKVCTNIVVDKKREETMIKKYSVKNAFQSENVKRKIEKTCLKKYGTTNAGGSEYAQSKIKNTCLVKYGVKNVFQVEKIKEKIKETCQLKFSSDYYLSSETHKQTMLKKYGVENLLQDVKYMEQHFLKSSYKKEYILPSGRNIKIQGYENRALTELLTKYDEIDMLYGISEINDALGIIRYVKPNNKNARYYPDFYVKSENLIIEVKSVWTYNLHKEINELKKQACLDLGYNFKFMIYNNDQDYTNKL